MTLEAILSPLHYFFPKAVTVYQVALSENPVPPKESWASASAEPDEAPYVCLGSNQEALEMGVTAIHHKPPANCYEAFNPLSPEAPYRQALLAWR